MSQEEVTGTVEGSVEGSPTNEVRAVVEHSKPVKLAEVDRMALELSKSQRQIALAEAKTALANNEKAELQYKYVVLQIYMKYGLTNADAVNEEDGTILYNGANNNG